MAGRRGSVGAGGARIDGTCLLISQVYVPDPAAVGQHLRDAAVTLSKRFERVQVLTAARGYAEPSLRYPRRETLDGVEVTRLPHPGLGKTSLRSRVLGGLWFAVAALLRGMVVRQVHTVVVCTSPPLDPFAGLIVAVLRRARLIVWVMDVNPEQSIAVGALKPDALSARLLTRGYQVLLRSADGIVCLDRFMAQRISAKADVAHRITIVPPWAHEEHVQPVPHLANPFREGHGLRNCFVVMYSGNHSPSNPLTTLLAAAQRLAGEQGIRFVFVGGGNEKLRVNEVASGNIMSLPFEPVEALRYSLSAADVHVVSVGDEVIGLVHPSKIYGAMAAARPVIVIGPDHCEHAELVREYGFGWGVRHGDVDGLVRLIQRLRAADPEERVAMGERGRAALLAHHPQSLLCTRVADVIAGGSEQRN
jgi:colanic acid biosynthesis glycosyl transferase WcaI